MKGPGVGSKGSVGGRPGSACASGPGEMRAPCYASRRPGRQRISPPLRTSTLAHTFFVFCCVGFFLQPVSELVALLSELGRKVKSLERDLETVKATFGRNAEELAKSREERRALKGKLDQICNVAQLIVSEVFGLVPSTSGLQSGWRRFQMRFGPSSLTGYSIGRWGC